MSSHGQKSREENASGKQERGMERGKGEVKDLETVNEDEGRGPRGATRRAGGGERVKRVRRRNGWKAKRGEQEGGYQERTSQVAVRWRIIIIVAHHP